jgi:phosphoenolpyruvate-protein kinase (PTS system EI component)
MLRAAVGAELSILLPMVTHAGDVLEAKAHIKQVRGELDREGIPYNPDVRVGAMLEVPSAALGIRDLLEVVDFLSVGTNDMIQYLTASDRDNPAVLQYQTPEVSGLYHLLEYVMQAARAVGREQDISVCGELASNPESAVALVRLGISSLSITPTVSSRVRRSIEAGHPVSK